MLTAAIGISSVVATIAIIEGADKILSSSISDLGTNIVVAQNGQGLQSRIRGASKAEELLKKVPGVKNIFKKQPIDERDVSNLRKLYEGQDILISPAVIQGMNSESNVREENIRSTVVATDGAYFKMIAVGEIAGRAMTPEEIRDGRRVCVLDESEVYRLLGNEYRPIEAIGKTVTISTKKETFSLEVVGVLRDPYAMRLKGNRKLDVGTVARSVFFTRLEYKNIYVPYALLAGAEEMQINTIFVTPASLDDVDAVQASLKDYMSKHNKDVLVWDQKRWIFDTTGVIESFTAVNHSVWIMILCVAMIMIVTITLVSVRERYYEIAVRITEGATKGKIILQFALESLYQSVTGGVLGIVLGLIMIRFCERHIIRWPAPVSPKILGFAILVSIGIGLLTSIPTAKRAASLNPVDVLRMH